MITTTTVPRWNLEQTILGIFNIISIYTKKQKLLCCLHTCINFTMYFAPYTLPSKNLRLKKSTTPQFWAIFFVKSNFHEKFVIFFCKKQKSLWYPSLMNLCLIESNYSYPKKPKNSGIYDYTNAKILNEKKLTKKNLFDW